jgi:hypothetical protein
MKQNSRVALSILFSALLLSISCVLFYPAGGELKFEPAKLPDARLGVEYEAKIHVTENRTPVGDFGLSKGALPAGLDLVKLEDEEDTASIRGVPGEAGTYTFTVSVWCYGTNVSGQTGEKEYTLVVSE